MQSGTLFCTISVEISAICPKFKEIPWKSSWAMDKLPENLIPAMAVGKPPHPNQHCYFTLCTTSPIGKQDFKRQQLTSISKREGLCNTQ